MTSGEYSKAAWFFLVLYALVPFVSLGTFIAPASKSKWNRSAPPLSRLARSARQATCSSEWNAHISSKRWPMRFMASMPT